MDGQEDTPREISPRKAQLSRSSLLCLPGVCAGLVPSRMGDEISVQVTGPSSIVDLSYRASERSPRHKKQHPELEESEFAAERNHFRRASFSRVPLQVWNNHQDSTNHHTSLAYSPAQELSRRRFSLHTTTPELSPSFSFFASRMPADLPTPPNSAQHEQCQKNELICHDKAFENASTSVAASQMRNALNNLADTVTDPTEKKV